MSKESSWVSVKEQLPKVEVWVFTCSEDFGEIQCIGVSMWNGSEWISSENEVINVDYWMLVPSLPEEV